MSRKKLRRIECLNFKRICQMSKRKSWPYICMGIMIRCKTAQLLPNVLKNICKMRFWLFRNRRKSVIKTKIICSGSVCLTLMLKTGAETLKYLRKKFLIYTKMPASMFLIVLSGLMNLFLKCKQNSELMMLILI